METIGKRIGTLDLSLFAAIPSQTTPNDKKALLFLQNMVRKRGSYVYLEIGSYQGGTVQQHYIDPLCRLIYSIDKRGDIQPDERNQEFEYPDNSTESMLRNLSDEFPFVDRNKIRTYDSDASEIKTEEITEAPDFCFIDGEHTNKAVFSDFRFCLEVSHQDAITVFHDACFVFKGINRIKSYLSGRAIRFKGFMLDDSIYVILLNQAADFYSETIAPFSKNESDYFKEARKMLLKIKIKNRIKKFPLVNQVLQRIKKRIY